jgi:hypothetical protein
MLSDRQICRGWHCDACGELIRTFEAGRLEWLCDGEDRVHGLRLVHRRGLPPPHSAGCEYDRNEEYRKDGSLIEGLSLATLSGVDGLMLMLAMLVRGEHPAEQIIEVIKRLYVPGYEQTRNFFPRAISENIIVPAIGPGYYLQSEIQNVLQWMQVNSNATTLEERT